MRPSRDLEKLAAVAENRLGQMLHAVSVAASRADKAAQRCVVAEIIDAQNLWQHFVRSFFISAYTGGKCASGVHCLVLNSTAGQYADPIEFAIATTNPKTYSQKKTKGIAFSFRDEPPWHLEWVLPRLAQAAGLSNHSSIVSAFSVPGRAVADLPTIRNYYAHRSERTAVLVRGLAPAYLYPKDTKPSVLPLLPHPTIGASIGEVWLIQLRNMARLLVQ